MHDVPELAMVVCGLPSNQCMWETPEGVPHKTWKAGPDTIAIQRMLQSVAKMPRNAPDANDCVSLSRCMHEERVEDALLCG